LILFNEFVGLRDNSALGVTIGSVSQLEASDLINTLMNRRFEKPPPGLQWKHFSFLDLDEKPVLEVVAESCSFSVA
jgi:hypothetical protein